MVPRLGFLGASALALWMLTAQAQAQGRVDLPLEQARDLARAALVAGDAAVALDLAAGIAAQFPVDRGAQALIAAAAPQQGQPARGVQAGARAYALSQTAPERYEAARLTAFAAARAGQFTRATWWMRRALIQAPSAADRAQTLADARQIAQQNPLAVDLTLTLAPSSNVNGGADDAQVTAPGNFAGRLSDSGLAQAGWRGSLGAQISARLAQDAVSRSALALSVQAARVRITDDVDLPDAAFATDLAALEWRHDRALGSGALGLRIGQSRVQYRQLDEAALTTRLRHFDVTSASVERRLPMGQRAQLALSLGRDWTRYADAAIGSTAQTRAAAQVALGLAWGDLLRLGAHRQITQADNANYRQRDWGVQIGYGFAAPIGPLAVNLGAGVIWSDYPDYALLFPVTGGRQDRAIFAQADLALPDLAYAGFMPAVTVQAQDTTSNVSRFTRRSLSFGLSMRSAF